MNDYNNTFEEYENIEFTLNDGQSDYDLDAQESDFLSAFNQESQPRYPTYVHIRTNQTISVKINSTSNNSITIPSTDSPFEIKGLKIRNMYFSNSSGNSSTVRLLFFIPSV